ncbi:MAG: SDR family oxidoreductase [Lautropia sp.]
MSAPATSSSAPLAWITGGATGIGFATAQALGRTGHALALSGRREAELAAACDRLRDAGFAAEAHVLDVADATAVARVARALLDRHGRVDTLVCSAGTNVPQRHWKDLTAEGFRRVTAINLDGVAYCVAAVLPAMRGQGSGTIVVVSSWAGWRFTDFTGAAYGASKTALSPLVQSINAEEGRNGIRATLVCPGEVATPILRSRPVPPSAEEIGRMLKPEDVADAIGYVVGAPAHVCIDELVISPRWNRMYIGGEDLKRR